jgi:hypothetical protein
VLGSGVRGDVCQTRQLGRHDVWSEIGLELSLQLAATEEPHRGRDLSPQGNREQPVEPSHHRAAVQPELRRDESQVTELVAENLVEQAPDARCDLRVPRDSTGVGRSERLGGERREERLAPCERSPPQVRLASRSTRKRR